MPPIADAVPEQALDCGEIRRRGGYNGGGEDFALFKCPHCGQVYLREYQADTIFLDAGDLSWRLGSFDHAQAFDGAACAAPLPSNRPWIGPRALPAMQVSWSELAASPWRWITQRTRREH